MISFFFSFFFNKLIKHTQKQKLHKTVAEWRASVLSFPSLLALEQIQMAVESLTHKLETDVDRGRTFHVSS